MYLSEAARGLLINFSTYCRRTDWWSYNFIFYEYGAHDEVIIGQVRSYAFRPHIYESASEKHLFAVDICRIATTLLLFIAILIFKVP